MISIIIPTLNEEKAVYETVSELKNRLKIPHEIIVSDDLSDDKTVEAARKVADKVVTLDTQPRLSAAAVRNRGAKIAVGEFLVFMDCGCSMDIDPNHFFEMALEHFQNPKVVGVTAAVRVLPTVASKRDVFISAVLNAGYWFFNNVLHYGTAWGKFQMIRKTSFAELGGYREDLTAGEDINLFHRLSKIGRTKFDYRLVVFHENRRAHQIGWSRLLTIWTVNTIYRVIFNKSFSKEWKPIR